MIRLLDVLKGRPVELFAVHRSSPREDPGDDDQFIMDRTEWKWSVSKVILWMRCHSNTKLNNSLTPCAAV